MIRRSLSLAFAAFLALLFTADAFAATVSMCRGTKAGAASGPASWVARGSQTRYGLDVRGCAVIAAADIPDAIGNGFVSARTLRADTYTGLSATSSPMTITLPPGTFIAYLIAHETAGGSATGGLKVGTTSGGTDVVTAWTVGASAYTTASDVSLLKRAFSTTASQQLFINAVTSFASSGSIDITVVYGNF